MCDDMMFQTGVECYGCQNSSEAYHSQFLNFRTLSRSTATPGEKSDHRSLDRRASLLLHIGAFVVRHAAPNRPVLATCVTRTGLFSTAPASLHKTGGCSRPLESANHGDQSPPRLRQRQHEESTDPLLTSTNASLAKNVTAFITTARHLHNYTLIHELEQ